MKKLFVVQVDGLSYPALQLALTNGLMPWTKSLLEKGFTAHELFCGLPSTTPCSLLQVMYGSKDLVNFQFYIRQTKKIFHPQYIDTVRWIEDFTRKKYPNALGNDITAICTIFGGKKQHGVSIGMAGEGPLWKQTSGIRLLKYFLHPYKLFLFVIKMLTVSMLEIRAGKQAPTMVRATRHTNKSIAGRLLEELLTGEIGLFYSKQAIRDSDPVIYVNFAGYDNLSHHYGSYSKPSMAYLSLADLYIQQIFAYAQKNGYECVVVSDHGQAPSVPLEVKFGKSLGEHIRSMYPGTILYENHSLGEKVPENVDLLVLSSGGYATIHNVHADHALKREELEQTYPEFAKRVSLLDGVGYVAIRQDGGVNIVRDGRDYPLSAEASHEYLPQLSARERALCIEEIRSLFASPFAPDCSVFSQVLSEDEVIAFEHHWGTHGGIGNEQTRSVCITRLPMEPDRLTNLTDLHDWLRSAVYAV